MTSRQAALQVMVHLFDGFAVREEWDVPERITDTLNACGYEELFEFILDALIESRHVHFADGCAGSQQQRRSYQKAQARKRHADENTKAVVEQRDALREAIRRHQCAIVAGDRLSDDVDIELWSLVDEQRPEPVEASDGPL